MDSLKLHIASVDTFHQKDDCGAPGWSFLALMCALLKLEQYVPDVLELREGSPEGGGGGGGGFGRELINRLFELAFIERATEKERVSFWGVWGLCNIGEKGART
jgi:hypothetical protein